MPLLPGKKNIGHNIEELESTGRKHSQAVAIALSEARKTGAHIPYPHGEHHPSPRKEKR
jgi:3-dehydroquinate synthetase